MSSTTYLPPDHRRAVGGHDDERHGDLVLHVDDVLDTVRVAKEAAERVYHGRTHGRHRVR